MTGNTGRIVIGSVGAEAPSRHSIHGLAIVECGTFRWTLAADQGAVAASASANGAP